MTSPTKSTSDLPQQEVQSVPKHVRERRCPHCRGSLERYEDPKAIDIIGSLQAQLAEAQKQLAAKDAEIERLRRDLGEALAFYRIVAYDPNMAQHRGLVEDARRSIDRIEPILQTVTAALTTAHSRSPA